MFPVAIGIVGSGVEGHHLVTAVGHRVRVVNHHRRTYEGHSLVGVASIDVSGGRKEEILVGNGSVIILTVVAAAELLLLTVH